MSETRDGDSLLPRSENFPAAPEPLPTSVQSERVVAVISVLVAGAGGILYALFQFFAGDGLLLATVALVPRPRRPGRRNGGLHQGVSNIELTLLLFALLAFLLLTLSALLLLTLLDIMLLTLSVLFFKFSAPSAALSTTSRARVCSSLLLSFIALEVILPLYLPLVVDCSLLAVPIMSHCRRHAPLCFVTVLRRYAVPPEHVFLG